VGEDVSLIMLPEIFGSWNKRLQHWRNWADSCFWRHMICTICRSDCSGPQLSRGNTSTAWVTSSLSTACGRY